MLRPEGDAGGQGRRPLLATFEGNNRQILQGIRDNLSHVLSKNSPNQGQGTHPANRTDMQIKAGAAAKAEGPHGAGAGLQPGNPGAPPATVAKPNERLVYNQKAMASIKQDLRGFQISEPPNGGVNPVVMRNGYDIESMPVQEPHLRSLVSMGYDEVCIASYLNLIKCC